jgi:geranylgeranyl diphosphate synthase type I
LNGRDHAILAEHAPTGEMGDLAVLRREIDQALVDWLESQRADFVRSPVFASLYDELVEFARRPGKRLRPLLFLLACRIFEPRGLGGERVAPQALVQVAASLELLHAFILVHDDIIDRAETRRGQPTLHRVFEGRFSSFTDRHRAGRNLALVMGDILFALAQKCLLDAALPAGAASRLGSMLLGCMVETGFGEAADVIYSSRDVSKVEIDEIEQMYCQKTTCYTIEGPLAMAAVLAGCGDETLAAIGRIARPAGLAFQIQNDLQEFARFEVSDAEVPADLLEGKKTLLVRTAFDRLSELDRGMLQLCFSAGTPTEGTVSKARELVAKSGAVGELTRKMDQLFAASHQETSWSGFDPETQRALAVLLRVIRGAAAQA